MKTQTALKKTILILFLGVFSLSGYALYPGCTDPEACNYDPSAISDDGSCYYVAPNDIRSSAHAVIAGIAVLADNKCSQSNGNAATCWLDDVQNDIWYSFVAPLKGKVVVETFSDLASDLLDTQIAVYESVDSDPVACDDNSGDGSNAKVELSCSELQPGHIYYVQLDGYNGATGTCLFHVIFENIEGCTDTGALNFSACATIDDGSCSKTGCTNPSACNYNPNATLDDGSCITETCLAGDNPWTAIPLQVTKFGTCNFLNKTLSGASVSSAAKSEVVTGEDLWFSITPQTKGIRVKVVSAENDIVIELLDQNYELIESVNMLAGIGSEVLNFGSLQAGNNYFIGVRNYDSSSGIGSFSICVHSLKSTAWVTAPTYSSLCDILKTSYCGDGTYYRFEFTLLSDPTQIFTRTQSSNLLPLSYMTGLIYNGTYILKTSAIYQLTNSLGEMESIVVAPESAVQITIGAQPHTELIAADRCESGAKSLYSWVRASYSCGASDYKWYFEEMVNGSPAGIPFVKYRGAASNLINLSSIPQLQSGKTYRVRVAPVFGGLGGAINPGMDGVYGSFQNLCIIGSALVLPKGENELDSNGQERSVQISFETTMYPNPNNGERLMVKFVPNDDSGEVDIYLYDSLGQQIVKNHFAFEGMLSAEFDLSKIRNSGVYIVEFVTSEQRISKLLTIQK